MVTGIRIPDILERAFCTHPKQSSFYRGEMTTAKQSWAFDGTVAPLAAGHLMVLCDTQQLGNHHNSPAAPAWLWSLRSWRLRGVPDTTEA